MTKRTTAWGCASIFGIFSIFGSSAFAGEEVLLRNDMTFYECPAAIEGMLKHLGANSNHVSTISDTGAHYYVQLEAHTANLEFRCNAVTEQLEVARVTPGTLERLAAE